MIQITRGKDIQVQGLPGNKWVYRWSTDQFFTLEEAERLGLFTHIPAFFCFLFLSDDRTERKVIWTDAPGRNIFTENANGRWMNLIVYNYLSHTFTYHCYNPALNPLEVGAGWEVKSHGEIPADCYSSSVPENRALALAAPLCSLCRKDLPIHPLYGFCSRCLEAAREHTPRCLSAWAAIERKRAAFHSLHPRLCSHCAGHGLETTYNGRWEPPDTDLCPRCAAQEQCPWCGNALHLVEYNGGDGIRFDNFYACGTCSWSENLELPPPQSGAFEGYWCDCQPIKLGTDW